MGEIVILLAVAVVTFPLFLWARRQAREAEAVLRRGGTLAGLSLLYGPITKGPPK